MEIIIRGTPEECKKAIKELAEKEKEYVPIYPTYPYYYPNWWYYNWASDNWEPTTSSITGTSSTYSIFANDIKSAKDISASISY